jgi:hypothetical protein
MSVMETVNPYEAKTNLSHLVEWAAAGFGGEDA